MEKDSPAKPSVAELAGRFKGHVIPTPTAHDENPSIASPDLSKVKMKKSKSSPLIEKLQANLTLSPTSLLPSPKSPEVKLAPMPISPTTLCFSPTSPCSPLSATLRPQLSSEEEEPVSFERPAEGTPLPSFNKNRVRLSFKRRPSTRQHRKSYVEEGIVSEGGCVSKGDPDGPQFNGAEEQVFEQPDEGGQGAGVTRGSPPSHPDTLTETGDNDRDSEEDKVLEEETGESAPPTQDVEEEAGKEEAGEQALGETQASDSLEAVEEVGSCSSFGTIGDNNQTEEQEDPPQTQERDENL